jgi:hypothetical protein
MGEKSFGVQNNEVGAVALSARKCAYQTSVTHPAATSCAA